MYRCSELLTNVFDILSCPKALFVFSCQTQALVPLVVKNNVKQSNVMQSKATYYSLKIQSSIHNIIKKAKEVLSLNNNDPLLENACCDSGGIHTVEYFVSKDKEIDLYNRNVVALVNILDDVRAMTKASIIFDARNTRLTYPNISNEYSEEIIYRAFIKFCKY